MFIVALDVELAHGLYSSIRVDWNRMSLGSLSAMMSSPSFRASSATGPTPLGLLVVKTASYP